MNIKKYLPGILPLVLAVSVPAYADTIETFHVDATSVADTNYAAGAQHIYGTWTYDATTGQLLAEVITQDDVTNGNTYFYDNLTSPSTTSFDQNSTNMVLTIANGTDTTGDFWPGFSLTANWLHNPLQVNDNNPLDTQNSWSFDFGGYYYSMTGAITETSSVTTAVPEPAIIALLAAGLFGMGFTSRKNRLAAEFAANLQIPLDGCLSSGGISKPGVRNVRAGIFFKST